MEWSQGHAQYGITQTARTVKPFDGRLNEGGEQTHQSKLERRQGREAGRREVRWLNWNPTTRYASPRNGVAS